MRMDSYRYYTEESQWHRDPDFGDSIEWNEESGAGYRGTFYEREDKCYC